MSTPLVPVRIGGRTVHLKLEGANPTGSVKDRTAAALVDDLERRGALAPRATIVESTSGNLGVALAAIAQQRGYGFTAVVDPKTTAENLVHMRRLGARIELVETPDETGGYLLSRLERVRSLLAADADCSEQCNAGVRPLRCIVPNNCVWPDQYTSAANPVAHERGTGPEVLAQMDGVIDAVFVPVSTGGTLAGIARCLRRASPAAWIVAVDAVGSVALGGEPGPRLLTGIGASRPSTFLSRDLYDEVVRVSDAEAFGCCRELAATTSIAVGGSSGATIAACRRVLAARPELESVVCLCPDHGSRYASTIYADGWLRRHGIDARLPERV